MERRISKRVFSLVLWGIVFLGAFFIGTKIHYSDGDDAFFYQYSNSMGFLEYLKWRYESWTGRLSAEALLYLTFRSGIWFWRIANAFVLTLLPAGILLLAERVKGGAHGVWSAEEGNPGAGGDPLWAEPGYCLIALSGYLLMSVRTLGYAGIWITGSVNYTWCILCMLMALLPAADRVFGTGRFRKGQFFYAIPCAAVAAMSVEQTGAVLLAFEFLALGSLFLKERKTEPLLLVQALLSVLLFFVMFGAPGNALRVQAAVETCMPQYEQLSFGEHFFITAQWLLSSFANENVLFLAGIWIAGGVLLCRKLLRPEMRKGRLTLIVYVVLSFLFTLSAVLSCFGVGLFSDLGIVLKEMTGQIEVPRISDATGQNLFAMFWWSAALVFTFFLLWRAAKRPVLLLLTYLGSIAAEAVLSFSPTMYSSGERVFFLTDYMLLFLVILLYSQIKEAKWRRAVLCILLLFGGVRFLLQIPETLAMI